MATRSRRLGKGTLLRETRYWNLAGTARSRHLGRLNYAMMQSLDGYIADADGQIDWVLIDDEIHSFANEEASRGAIDIYGRRMYETMAVWESMADDQDLPQVEKDFAQKWKAIEKLVVSTSLPGVSTTRTRLIRSLDIDAIRALKQSTDGNLSVSGPTLATAFLDAGLVDEIGTYLMPVVLGGGTPFFPQPRAQFRLELTEERRFASGAVFLRYDVCS